MLYDTAAVTRWAYRAISPHELCKAEHAPFVIDVREPGEYATGHIPGSQLVPLGTVGAALRGWNRDEEIVVVCRSGARSGWVAEALASAGFSRVMNLVGGMLAYIAAGLPVERSRS
jgi:rhodanese-related sulfurtransferase